MVKRLIVALALLLAPTQVPAEPAPLAPNYKTGHRNWDWAPDADHHAAAVRIISGGGSGSGTAVWCDGTQAVILTANHVVDEIDRCMVNWSDGSTNIGKILGRDARHDLAVIICPVSGPREVIPLAIHPPRVGYRVEIMGYGGMRKPLRRFYGKIISHLDGNLEMEANLLPGDSGGGIVLGGQLIGVIYGGPYISDQFLDAGGRVWPLIYPASGTSVEHIRKLLEKVAPFAVPYQFTLGYVLIVLVGTAMMAVGLAAAATKLLGPLEEMDLFTGAQDNVE